MPRPRQKLPNIRCHVSGQAVISLAGQEYWLGKYDSPESLARFGALVSEFHRTGKAPSKDVADPDTPITIALLATEFVDRRLEEAYVADRQAGQKAKLKRVATMLSDDYGRMSVAEFGPRKLAEFRTSLVDSGNARNWVNEQIRAVVKIFQYGVSRELVSATQLESLRSLEPLKRGETKAGERQLRNPVPLDAVARTIPHCSPTVASMIRFQLATGCRPGEMFGITPGEIDRTGGTPIYRPTEHKTSHLGKLRSLPLNEDAMAAIMPLLSRRPDEPIFDPRESAQWYRDQRTSARVTPESTGNTVGKRRGSRGSKGTGKQGQKPGKRFAKDSYRQAVKRAAAKAGVDPWTPYQLRHATATAICDALGIEGAKALLGHSDVAITRTYVRTAEAKAIEASRYSPRLADPDTSDKMEV